MLLYVHKKKALSVGVVCQSVGNWVGLFHGSISLLTAGFVMQHCSCLVAYISILVLNVTIHFGLRLEWLGNSCGFTKDRVLINILVFIFSA